ncbi:cytochrome C oxidase subunit II [Neobacillus sp. MM2021_6]|uniref:cytochrome C oxidase subunit II n=1 Tax=Bacillaceae TaxID=186817 RepID=UPI0014092919|nr:MULTISPECIES: cytochrome C oxidase subunit II [Bacillaceae]MBO0961371.1 cytochrome C oxidase subunit II [Neobacillus sp. MM2021_6]NHC20540.1 cytochrome C oxidase subunit II [Bacillus sp. MM2020_4]
MYQQAAWIITILLSMFVIFLFLYVLSQSRKKADYAKVQKKWYFIRKVWFLILFTTLLTASYFTLKDLPFERVEAKGTPIDVEVTAMQFGFEVSEDVFKVGDYIAFHVTSKDVNHGFGLYDETMNIVAQTQAMPKYTNTVYYQFTKPGTYTILCMEYCGMAHHLMKREITVNK